MKFTTKSSELKTALSKLALLPGANGVDGISEFVKLVADLDGLTLERESAHAKITAPCPAEIAVEGERFMLFERLNRFVGVIMSEEIAFNASEEKAEIRAGQSKGSLAIIAPQKTNILRNEQDFKTLTMPAGLLAEMIKDTGRAFALPNQSKPTLEGIVLRSMDGILCMFGTDGRRLHNISTGAEIEIDCAVPKDTSAALRGLCQTEDEMTEVHLNIGDSRLEATSEGFTFSGAIMEDKPPGFGPYTEVGKKTVRVIAVPRGELLSACQAASAYAKDDNDFLSLNIDKKGITVRAGKDEYVFEHVIEGTKGIPKTYTFNWDYLADALSSLKEKEVTIEDMDNFSIVMREKDRMIAVANVRTSPAGK